MTLSEELTWRGFVNQTTYKDIAALDGEPISFYWGVDPSADSMQIGNLAAAMMARHFIAHGHKAFLLVGGATGLIGDPDGKSDERDLKSPEEIAQNKAKIAEQYAVIFADLSFEVVDNYDWFKDMGYLQFLRDVGKHVPLRQMVGREFVQSRLGETGSGISYAEFSYSLIQGYDFLHLHREHGVDLQICGADQWGNSITGVDLIRRVTGDEAHVWSTPLIVNKSTGVKFGKSEDGAIWLATDKTSAFKFYQFWLNADDLGVESYLKVFTLLDKEDIDKVLAEFNDNRGGRAAQKALAYEVTKLIHGEVAAHRQQQIAASLSGEVPVGQLNDEAVASLRAEMPTVKADAQATVTATLVTAGLASSLSEARRLLAENGISINGQKVDRDNFEAVDFQNGRLLLRRGKAYKDSALIEQV